MLEKNIIPENKKISNVIRFILNKKPVDGKVEVTGSEIRREYDYDFITSALLVTINYNQKSPEEYNVSEFWGNQIRIDVTGLDDQGSPKTKKSIKETLWKAFPDFIDIIYLDRHHYSTLSR